jgi:hypothetical protein
VDDELVPVVEVDTIVVATGVVTVDTTVDPEDVTVESSVDATVEVETWLTVAVTVVTAVELDDEAIGVASNNVSSQKTGLVSACVL